jgi:hypothetical protein
MLKELELLREMKHMTTADALALAKAHPDTAASVLGTIGDAVKANPTLIPDIITAVETKNWLGFVFSHLGLILQLAGLVGANPAVVTSIQGLAPK